MAWFWDIPENGTEDYDTWKARQLAIEDIQDFADVYEYLQTDDESAQEFFEGFGIKDYKSKILIAPMKPTLDLQAVCPNPTIKPPRGPRAFVMAALAQ
ncbi:MAG: hypothetical protein P8L68_16130 [Paracoccaceae bacterium]|nr:hypothetical protein [Paracoccaceae bacterium]MDG2260013.1 hypothetical protein [Paracoccaceae bacterium]